MEISCSNCAQKFHIPDYRLDDKRVYFFCEKCKNKVVIDNKKEAWAEYKGIPEENLSAKDILEGIFYSFNIKNITVSFLFLLFFSIFILLSGFIIFENFNSFISHPFLFAVYILFSAVFLSFLYDTMLYLVTKNIFHRIHYGSNVAYSLIRHEIFNDLISVFILSSGMLLIFVLAVLPAYPLKRFGILYTGIFEPVLITAALIIVFVSIFKPIIISFISLRSRRAKFTIKSLFRFIAVENLNIPAYSFLNSAVMNFIYFLTIIIVGSAILGTGAIIILSLMPEAIQIITSSPQNMFSAISSIAGSGVFNAGIIFVIFWIYILNLLILSYFISAAQSLAAVSVHIMESNPGRSVSKRAFLISLSLGFLFTGSIFFILKNIILLFPKF
jgi:DNA-directed RNA polymerase subunit RPC12/RpoP